jgi:hypothetical protein
MFLAQDLSQGVATPEQTELLTHKIISFSELMRQVQTGENMDTLTVIAAFRAANVLKFSV